MSSMNCAVPIDIQPQVNSAVAASLPGAIAGLISANVPPPVNATGAAGNTGQVADAGHTHVSSVFKAITTTDASGMIAWTYPAGMFSAPPVIQMTPEAGTTGQPMTVNIVTNTKDGGTGQVLRAQTLPASLTLVTALASFNIFGGTVPTGTKVHVYAAKASAA